jgi:predicted RNA binding protein YcfA (HicA-like mRNA interferase family)
VHVIREGLWEGILKFSELVRLLEAHGFELVKEKGSIRYYGKAGWPALIRVDFHGAKEVPSGTCYHILKSAGIKKGESHD